MWDWAGSVPRVLSWETDSIQFPSFVLHGAGLSLLQARGCEESTALQAAVAHQLLMAALCL